MFLFLTGYLFEGLSQGRALAFIESNGLTCLARGIYIALIVLKGVFVFKAIMDDVSAGCR